MKKKFTIEEIAGVLGMTFDGVLDYILPRIRVQNAAKRGNIPLKELTLNPNLDGEIEIDEFLRWSEFCNSKWLCRDIPRIDKKFIRILEEGDPEKIKRLVELNNERLRVLKERKQILRGD